MRMPSLLTAAVLAFGLAVAEDSFAAKRFGGGGNLGKQKAVPTNNVPASPPASAPAATPAAAPAAAGAAGAAAAKPSFMSRWGGLLAGLGIGALLASMFGANMGPVVGMLLAVLLVGGLAFFLFRMFASRGAPGPAASAGGAAAATAPRPAFSGIGSNIPGAQPQDAAPLAAAAAVSATTLAPDFDVPNFLRGAKTTFIRLQAASDSKDLDDIRDFTSPELYAEIAMLLKERGDEPQRTEVVSIDARLANFDRENGYDIASVRYTGLIRENDSANPEPVDEIWHVRKKTGDKNPAWQIAGIQQVAE